MEKIELSNHIFGMLFWVIKAIFRQNKFTKEKRYRKKNNLLCISLKEKNNNQHAQQ
jgi:hypothetical protein